MDEELKSKGILKKYIIKKADKSPVDPEAEYFVLRLDYHSAGDHHHVRACREALLLYADKIAFHLPILAKEIKEKYGDRYDRFHPEGLDIVRALLDEHEKTVGHRYGHHEGDRLRSILNYYQRQLADKAAVRKEFIEKVVTNFIAFKMVVETIGMAGTHSEKAARIRGLIELLDNSISKLRQEQTSDIESHWPEFMFGNRSEYPYKSILEKLDNFKRENEDLKRQLMAATNQQPKTEDKDYFEA